MAEDGDIPGLDLIKCGLALFGESGFEGVSTRAIARCCNRPMSAITYHFGGKHGLYLACARYISDTMTGFVGGIASAPIPDKPADARQQIGLVFATMTQSMLRNETALFVRFIIREQQEPTEAFDIIYGGVMGRMLDRLAALVRVVGGGRIGEVESRIHAIAMMGQVLAFRVARAAILRSTGWPDVGPDETAQISAVVQAHVAAVLDSLERGQQS
jgi:AcrR family transcriptional regulator